MLPVSPIITASTIEFQRAQKANDTPHLDCIAENYNDIINHPEAIPARILPLEVVEDLGENKWWEEYPLHSSSSELPGVVGSAGGSRSAAARVPKPRASEKVTRPTPRLKASTQAESSRKRSAELVEDLEEAEERAKSRGKGKGKGKEVERNVEERAPASTSWSKSRETSEKFGE